MVDTKNYSDYFRLSEHRRLIFGGAPASPSPAPSRITGAPRSWRVAWRRYSRSSAPSGRLLLGRHRGLYHRSTAHAVEMDGVFYALGYGGHGVQMATYLGQCMAEVMDGHPEANPWRDLPFPKPPLVFNTPWYLPVAGAYCKLRDWLT